jgi:FkbM family methyltransferase
MKDIICHEPLDLNTFQFSHDKFSELIPEDSIVLDIGAHVGGFSIVFGSCVSKGKVLAFEPSPKTFSVLEENSKNNPHLNIVPFNYAATKENKNYTFYYSDPNIYGNGTNGGAFDEIESGKVSKQFHTYPIEVKGVNLYDFLVENYKDELHKIKFIKTDTEGYDKEVLRTLEPIIKQNRPVLMVESFRNATKEEILDYYNVLKSFDYEIYDASPLDNKTDCVGPITLEEFEYYTHKVVDNGNWFCFHKDDISKYALPTTIPGKTAVVVFGRNDGYKEKERFAIHLTTMLETFDEVIYIDWNSPTHSFLYEVIDMIPKTDRLKHFSISPEYAKLMSMNDPKAQICNSVLSFNIGLRRTDAEWVVLSTTDIIPPTKETLNDFITHANKNSMYTFSRRDIEYDDVISNLNTLDAFRQHLDNTTEPRYFPTKVTPNDEYSIFNCCGDFQLASKNLWHKIRGYEEMMLYACFVDTNAQKKAVLYGFNLVPIYDIPLYHMSHKGMSNDGSSPSKQHYNDAWEWVENFNKYLEHGHIMFSRNADTWGFSNIEIEHELI